MVSATTKRLNLLGGLFLYPPKALCTNFREFLDADAGRQLGSAHMQPLDGSLRVVGEVDVYGHHVGVPRERLAAEGIVHGQPLSGYPV